MRLTWLSDPKHPTRGPFRVARQVGWDQALYTTESLETALKLAHTPEEYLIFVMVTDAYTNKRLFMVQHAE